MKIYTQKEFDKKIYEALTIQALRIRSEMFRDSRSGNFDVKTFDNEYLSNLGDYEREIAKKEGITIKEW